MEAIKHCCYTWSVRIRASFKKVRLKNKRITHLALFESRLQYLFALVSIFGLMGASMSSGLASITSLLSGLLGLGGFVWVSLRIEKLLRIYGGRA